MKVQIKYTVDITDEIRRAMRRYYGGTGEATRAEVRDFYETHGATLDDDLKDHTLM